VEIITFAFLALIVLVAAALLAVSLRWTIPAVKTAVADTFSPADGHRPLTQLR